VVPIIKGDTVLGEIDVDSDQAAAFGDADRVLLEAVANALATRLSRPEWGGGAPRGRE
jgi:GAF domain-containing protein